MYSALVLVSVMEVRHMWVSVDEFTVLVDVAVPADKPVGVLVVVMPVAVVVLVGVLHRMVLMLVQVARTQRERHA